jgi:hypothetical protein
MLTGGVAEFAPPNSRTPATTARAAAITQMTTVDREVSCTGRK